MSKPKTQAQLNRATDARLQKTYNITLRDYDYLSRLNDGKCWISSQPPATRRLHVDHDHAYKKVAIEARKMGNVWDVAGTYNGVVYCASSPKRSLAVRELKRKLLRASVRGLLAYNMNAGLQKFSDNPVLLRAAANYLEEFKQGSPLTGREEGV